MTMPGPQRGSQATTSDRTPRQLQIAGRLQQVYGARAPAVVEHNEPVLSWPVFASATLARASYCLESIVLLEARELDAALLCRSLYEHVVTFAWVAIDPGVHLSQLLKDEADELRKSNNDIGKFFTAERDIRRLEQLQQFSRGVAGEMPSLLGRAKAADGYWARLLNTFTSGKYGFDGQYTAVYRQFSLFVHPTTWGLEPFVSGTGEQRTIGSPRSQGGYAVTMAPILFAQALLVASDRLGWPPTAEVLAAFGTAEPAGGRGDDG